MKTIWCLFSIANNYDQPSNNLVGWWPEQPTLEELMQVIRQDGTDGIFGLVVEVLNGKDTPVTFLELREGGTTYRLRQVESGGLCNG